jgi:two-component system, chemotaxis family, sensor kinase CheA
MTRPAISDRLMAIFRGELQDHVRSIEHDLLALERDPDPAAKADLHTSLFRSVHSLKGAARVVGEEAVETACHRLEGIFQQFSDGGLAVDASLFQLLLATVDAIRQTGDLTGARQDADAALQALSPRLDMVTGQGSERDSVPAVADAIDHPSAVDVRQSPPDGFVRVPAAKLDMLLSRSEQLLVAQRRTEVQDQILAGLSDSMQAWRRQWPDIERKVALAFAVDGANPSGPTGGSTTARRVQAARRALANYQAGQRRLAHDLQAVGDHLTSDRRALNASARALDGEIRRVRMFPFASACEGLDRAARDLTAGGDKDLRIVVEGGDIELDRSILDGLRDPLLHLVRNAVDHGIEAADVRQRAGKPPAGRITIAAKLRGMQVEVEVADDGRGVDLDAVREAARKRGLSQSGSPDVLVGHIFQAGFSTSRTVTPLSGRGVGLDVVKSRVEAMRGMVEVNTDPGRGTRFKLTLPLTLTTVRGLLVSVAGQICALDAASVRKLLRVEMGDIRSVEGRAMLTSESGPIMLVSLASQLGFTEAKAKPAIQKIPVVVLAAADRQVAFAVDELLSEQELLVRGLGARLKRIRYVTGGTMLPDGRIALILHAHDLIHGAVAGPTDPAFMSTAAQSPHAARKRLMLADDSVTTRTLMKTILEGAGYEVLAVPDGAEAWRRVQDGGVDLVVSDVEMPQMDGVALTEAIRDSARLRDLPVILVTALESEDARARGLRAGASAYLTKSAFDQRELLGVVEQLL